jgi:hypothetical protein
MYSIHTEGDATDAGKKVTSKKTALVT